MLTDTQKQQALDFFQTTQLTLGKALENVDGRACLDMQSWDRHDGGGGIMAVMRGDVVEKAGVNMSCVYGPAFPALEKEHAGKPFWAAGLSSITHMMNPYAPIGHMNVRLIQAGDEFWVGGGGDLTPFIPFEEDTKDFHLAFKQACQEFNPQAYEDFRKQCDDYFYIPHRKSIRGVGGIFFDHQKGDFDRLFQFITNVAMAYVEVFPKILNRRKKTPYTDAQKNSQLYWRGRYAEFNLAYDRGTRFGLMTGGNPDAIFVSLPPVVKW